MSIPLPSTSSLLNGLDALERQLTELERGRAPLRFERSSTDTFIKVVADGLGRLVSVTLNPAVATRPAATLAGQVKDVVNAALAAANAATATAISTAANTFALPGLPAQGQAPPDFVDFIAMVGSITSQLVGADPCNTTKVFECTVGPVRAVANGQRQIVTLVYTSPLPRFLAFLESCTVTAVNCAIGKATDREDDKEDGGGVIVDGGTATFQNTVIYAAGELLIDDRVRITDQAGTGFGRICNAGMVQTNIGVTADVGQVISRAKVVVRDRGRVHGSIRTSGVLETQNNTEITGPVLENAAVILPELLVNVAFTGTPLPAINLEPNTQATAAPGYYAGITVKSGSTLTFTATGVYRCNSFQLEPQSRVIIRSGGPTYIYARDTFIYRGRIDDQQGGFPNLLVGHFGTSQTTVEAPFRGTIVSPTAKIQLATVGTAGHSGAFHGMNVEVFPDTRVTHRPFGVLYENIPNIVTPATPRARLFAFEDASAWRSPQPVSLRRVPNPVTQGKLALQISNITGRTELVSQPFTTAGLTAPTRKLRVDLWISSNQPIPTQVGQFQAIVRVPSAGINNVLIGTVQLTPLPRNVFSTMDLTMTQAVTTALTGNAPDASLTLVLDVKSGSGPYLFDNLRFA
jgi:DNA-binding protein YbaB